MKKTFRDYFYVLFGTGFSRFAAFINSIIIARWLGPEEFGRFTIFYIVMILAWQIPQAFDHTFIRYAKTVSSDAEKNVYLKTAVFIKIVYSVILLCLAYPLGGFLSNVVFQKPDTFFLIIGGMICGAFLSFLMSFASVFQEREEFGKYALIPSLYSGGILAILIGLKISGNMDQINLTKGLVGIYMAAALLLGAGSIAILIKKTGKLFQLDRTILKKNFSFGKWILGVTITYYLFQRIDVFVLTRYSIFKDVGIYFVAVQPVMVISLLMGSMAGVFMPKAMSAIKSRDALINHTKESLLTSLIPVSGIAALMLFAPYFIEIFYGAEYVAASNILRVLLLGWLFASFYLPFSFLFYALDDSRTRFILELLKVIIALSLLLYFVPSKGAYGAAASISIALVFNALISMIVLCIKLRNKPELRKASNVINTYS